MKIRQENLIMQFMEEKTQMTREMEEKRQRCSTTLVISKMQVDGIQYHFTPIRLTNILKSDNIKC